MAGLDVLMMDVDGVLVRGRPGDGLPWDTGLLADLGVDPIALRRHFFAPHWDEVVTGRAGLMERLRPVLAAIAPGVSAERLVEYWFARDARVDAALLAELAAIGVPVRLATNQEHLRARYLMETLGLGRHAGAIHYSAAVGARKPDPAFFARVAAEVGVPEAGLMLVDDVAENVAAARAAGWQARQWTGACGLGVLIGSK